MASNGPTGPAWANELDRWLAVLADHAMRVGVHERLRVHELLAQRAAEGEPPATLREAIALIGPLLCLSPEQQRGYARLMEDFVAGKLKSATPPSRRPPPKKPDWKRPPRVVGIFVAVAMLTVLAWRLSDFIRPPAAPLATISPVTVDSQPEPAFSVLPSALPLQASVTADPVWSSPQCWVFFVGEMSVLTLLAMPLIAAAYRKDMALQSKVSNDDLEHKLLHDSKPVDVSPHPMLARAVGRALRQRVAGESRTLDARGTLRATVAAQGVFTPHWRDLQRTPEYFVLIDARHPCDHQSDYAHVLVDALRSAGVTLQVFEYDTTPAAGCRQHGTPDHRDASTRHRMTLESLVLRAGCDRLIVVGDAAALLNPMTGALQPWVRSLRELRDRVWLTARPPRAWGDAESAADMAGFLVLPLQEAALQTLASWFVQRRAPLALDPDTPRSWPPLLRGNLLEWVARSDPPPPEAVDELLRQLREMLGGLRFQWLCACAVFPAVVPALTLALGQTVVGESRSLALGMSSLSSLPWFRYGRMPNWLRRELLQRLTPQLRATLDGEVQRRLKRAISGGDGKLLADVARPGRPVSGTKPPDPAPLRDVVLADFLRGKADSLATALPEELRQLLFEQRASTSGAQRALVATAVLGITIGAAALPPCWALIAGRQPQAPALDVLQDAPIALSEASAQITLRSAGEHRVVVEGRGKDLFIVSFREQGAVSRSTAAMRDASIDTTLPPLSTRNQDGIELDTSAAGLQLRSASGRALGGALDTGGQPVRLAGFTPSGSRVVALLGNGNVRTWGVRWGRDAVDVVLCSGIDPGSDAGSDMARMVSSVGGLDVTTWSGDTWLKLLAQAALPREIIILNESQRPIAQDIANRLSGSSGATPDTPRDIAIQGSNESSPGYFGMANWEGLSAAAIMVGACPTGTGGEPTLSGLDATERAKLRALVEKMFAPDASTRVAAAKSLMESPALFSDAVPLVIWRARRSLESPAAVDDSGESGVYNALVLLNAASPATLRRERGGIDALLNTASIGRPKTAQEAALLRSREFAAAAAPKFALSVQIAGDYQRPLAEALRGALRGQELTVDGIENIAGRAKAPGRPVLRVQGFSDRRIARTLRDDSTATLGVPMAIETVAAASPLNDTYEIWLDAGACKTRMLSDCAVSPAPLGAASAASTPPAGQPRTQAKDAKRHKGEKKAAT